MVATLTASDWKAKQEATRRRWREQAKARYHAQRKHRVYEVEFADGMRYVGVTAMPLSKRLLAHRRDCSVVGRRLDLGQEYDLFLYGEWDDRAEAERVEAEAIAALPKNLRLNLLTPVQDWKQNG